MQTRTKANCIVSIRRQVAMSLRSMLASCDKKALPEGGEGGCLAHCSRTRLQGYPSGFSHLCRCVQLQMRIIASMWATDPPSECLEPGLVLHCSSASLSFFLTESVSPPHAQVDKVDV